MKIAGVIVLILGILNFVINLIGLVSGSGLSEQMVRNIFFGVGFIGLGIFLITRANNKVKEQEEKDQWSKNQ